MTELVAVRYDSPPVVRTANITAKSGLIVMLVLTLLYPESGNMQDKAAGVRAIVYPALSFTVPVVWYLCWKERSSFPWLADLLVTITCFTDILGNRMDLYDTIVWFDDWMHFMNTGLLAAAAILLTMHRSTSLPRVVERALAVGATGAIAWEIGEYFAFISGSSHRHFAYADTLSDLGLGVFGALVAAVVIHRMWGQGLLTSAAPQLDTWPQIAHPDTERLR